MTNEHRKPTALERALDHHDWCSRGICTIDAARRELEIKTELCEATAAWMLWLIEKHKDEDWKCPYVANIAECFNAYRTWRAEQEKQS